MFRQTLGTGYEESRAQLIKLNGAPSFQERHILGNLAVED